VSNIFFPLLSNSNVLCLKDPQSIQFLTACLKALILEIQIIQFHPISLQITQFPEKVPQIFPNQPLPFKSSDFSPAAPTAARARPGYHPRHWPISPAAELPDGPGSPVGTEWRYGDQTVRPVVN
jgi:hypothetical protein